MGLRLTEQFPLGEGPTDLHIGLGEQFKTSFQLAQRGTALNHMIKGLRRWQLEQEDSPVISPEQANEVAPNLPEPIKNPIKLSVLQDIIAENDLRRSLEEKISFGPDGVMSSASQFSAALLAHAFDPFEFAAGALLAPAVGALGSRMISSSIAGQSSVWTGRLGVALARESRPTFTRLATEGILGNTIIEPLLFMGEMSDHQDANIYNTFVSVAGGSLGFAAGIKGLSEASRYLSKLGDMAVENSLRASTARFAAGKKINTDKMVSAMADEAHNGGATVKSERTAITSVSGSRTMDMNHQSKDITPKHQMEGPSFALQRARDTRWYIPHRFKGGIDIDKRMALNAINPGKYLGGEGIYLTDNPIVANGYASHSSIKTPGSVYEVNPFPDSQLINIQHIDYETIPPKSTARQLASAQLTKLGLNKTEVQKVLKNNPTYLEAMDRLIDLKDQGRLQGVKDISELQNWFIENVTRGDAVAYRGTKTVGVNHKPQNIMYIKPSTLNRLNKKGKKIIDVVDEYEADPSFNKTLTQEEMADIARDYNNPKSDRYYDEDAVTDYQKRSLNPTEDDVTAEVQRAYEDNKRMIDEMAAEDELTVEEQIIKEKLDDLETDHEIEMEIAQDTFRCRLDI